MGAERKGRGESGCAVSPRVAGAGVEKGGGEIAMVEAWDDEARMLRGAELSLVDGQVQKGD